MMQGCKNFYVKVRDGVYIHILASSIEEAKRLMPPNYTRVMTRGYFYEIERKRCKAKGIPVKLYSAPLADQYDKGPTVE